MTNLDSSNNLLSGHFVLHTLIAEFTVQVDKKVDHLLSHQSENISRLTKENLAKSLQRGEDPQFDQLLCSLGCVAEFCLPSLLDTLFEWYDLQLSDEEGCAEKSEEDRQHKQGSKNKSDCKQIHENGPHDCRAFAVKFVFCLVLIEVLKQIPVHPLPDSQISHILTKAFESFRISAVVKDTDTRTRIIADLYAEAIGVVAQAKFQSVRQKFLYELQKDKEVSSSTLIAFIWGMKYFRVKMYPIEDFEASFRFMQELATYSHDIKDREVKNALARLFVEVLIPVADAVKTEVNVPVLRDFVDSLYPTSLELSKRSKAKTKIALYPLVTCLLCVSQKTFFINNWHIFLDICLSTLKKNDSKLSRVALESLYRLLWVYMVRIKCESNTTTQARLQSIVKSLFPPGSRNVVPKDTPLNIFVKIIQYIALERLDYAMKEIILDLLAISSSTFRAPKHATLYPERMNIGLRAFLVITDSLQQKDGVPPMPSTMNVMPSGNTIRVRKVFLNQTLTEDDARAIGLLQYLRYVQKALDGILLSLDNQVGSRLLLTSQHFVNKDPQDFISPDQKPKIELFRTCVAALPRLMPHGMPHCDLLDMLCRLTIHVDSDLRSRAIASLQSFVIEFPIQSEEVVASYLTFILKQVTDIHLDLFESSLKILGALITTWKSSVIGTEPAKSPLKQFPKQQKKTEKPHSVNAGVSSGLERSAYGPIVNRIEGFAIVHVCSSRDVTRKFACHLLKEVRGLAHALNYGSEEEALCLDILDRLCPEVTEEVLKEESCFQELKSLDKDSILSASSEKDFSSLVEISMNWSEVHAVHPWIFFMKRFLETSRLPKFCSQALLYSWPDGYIRYTQVQRYIEPYMTTGSRKAANAPFVNGDQILVLWTHYLIFLCQSALPSMSVKQKQSADSGIAAGTPDWKAAMIHDTERLDALPSILFQKLVAILKSDNFPPAYKESVILGLGYTSTASFYDFLTELLNLMHEANEAKRQESVRRRRKRESIRILLVKLFANLSIHKVLSKGIYKQVEKLPGKQKIPKEVVHGFIEETCCYFESLEKSEMASLASSSQLQHASGSLMSLGLPSNSVEIKEDMKHNFANLIVNLVRYYPVTSRPNLLLPRTKMKLFHLFSHWYKHVNNGEASVNSNSLVMLCAQCSVLCCGPVFDEKGFGKKGYLYEWLESLLDCSNCYTRQLGQDSLLLLLHFNPSITDLNTWVLEKCYTGNDVVAATCFLTIVSIYSHSFYAKNIMAIIALALFKTTDSDPEISQSAGHLLGILLAKYMDKTSHPLSNGLQKRIGNLSYTTNKICYSGTFHPSLKVTEDLARAHPEITHAILSEIFLRLPAATQIRQRQLLEVTFPWLQNVELMLTYRSPHCHDQCKCSHNHPWMPLSGWGSKDGSLHVLNNLLYATMCYQSALEVELQNCWSVLCSTWHDNLMVCMHYFYALYSVHSDECLKAAVRLAIIYMSRSEGARVLSVLIDRCLLSTQIDVTVNPSTSEPYYEIVLQVDKSNSNGGSPIRKSTCLAGVQSPSDNYFREKSARPCVSSENSVTRINSKQSPSVEVESFSSLSHARPSHRYSLQMSQAPTSSIFTSSPASTSYKQSPKLSHSMISLSEARSETDGGNTTTFHSSLSSRPGNRTLNHSDMDAFPLKVTPKNFSLDSRPKSPKRKPFAKITLKSDDCVKFSKLADTDEFGEVVDWINCAHADCFPRPLPLFDKCYYLPLYDYISCDKVERVMYSSISCIFLSEIVFHRSVDINWDMNFPNVFLAITLNMDWNEIEKVSFYCRRMLAHIFLILLPDKIPSQLIGSILSYSSDSLKSTLSCTPLSVFLSSSCYNSQPNLDISYSDAKGIMSDEESSKSLESLLNTLMADGGNLWDAEEVTPKISSLKSVDKLSKFVKNASSIIDHFLPRIRFIDRLGLEASKFAVSMSDKHHACRSLQVYRALELALTPLFFNKLICSLANRIVYGVESELQSHVIEILLTLINDCDVDSQRKEKLKGISPKKESTRNLWKKYFDQSELNSLQSPCHSNICRPSEQTLWHMSSIPNDKVQSSVAPLSLPSDNSKEQAETPRHCRKIHAHRRSGSVTLSKKFAAQLLSSAAAQGDFHVASKSVPELRLNFSSGNSPRHIQLGSTKSQDRSESLTKSSESNYISPETASLNATSEFSTGTCSNNLDELFFPNNANCITYVTERKATFAQMFWVGVGLLESDYEHEFLMAVKLLDKVLSHLPLQCNESKGQIEGYLSQIKWNSFPGVQGLLLKGLTSLVTYEATFCLLSSFTAFSCLPLLSGHLSGSRGFAMNVVALLPNLLDHFADPNPTCVDAARTISSVCKEKYSQEKKLQNLAHVMVLYSNCAYEQTSAVWINVVIKYIHESFPEGIHEQLELLLNMLDKGPSTTHLSCLRIVYSLLFLSEFLLINSQPEVKFLQNILKTVSRFVNNTKLWNAALLILKLAVSRSSTIITPKISSLFSVNTTFSCDNDRVELPGRTLTFKFNLSDTPIVGRRRLADQLQRKHSQTGSPSYYPNTITSSTWKKPLLSQKRTFERISSIAVICGKHLQISNELSPKVGVVSLDSLENDLSQTETVLKENTEEVGKSHDHDTANEDEEQNIDKEENVPDDFIVLRNFDFLDELEENDDGFTTGYQNQSVSEPALDEINATEDEPDTCNLTPYSRDACQIIGRNGVDVEYISDHSDMEEQECASQSSGLGLLSHSWSVRKSSSTEFSPNGVHSSLITISSIERQEKIIDDEKIERKPADKLMDMKGYCYLQNRLTRSETDLYRKGLSHGEVNIMKRANHDKMSDSLSSLVSSIGSLIASIEDLNMSDLGAPNHAADDPEQSHNDLLSSLNVLTMPPPPSLLTPQHAKSFVLTDTIDIPIIEPPPVTNDITSKLSIVRFPSNSLSHFLPVADSLSKSAPSVPAPPGFSASDQSPVLNEDTIYTVWKLHSASVVTHDDTMFITKTFDLFPLLFNALCIDFSSFSQKSCKQLGGQLARIAEHFSSMVEQLPNQIKCPHFLITKRTIVPAASDIIEKIKGIETHLISYDMNQKSALELVELIQNHEKCYSDEMGTAVGHQHCIGRKQLDLCRILYQLHYQLLLLLKNFNKIIGYVTSGASEPGTKDITDQLNPLRKKILIVEKSFQTPRDKQDSELLNDLKSKTVKEAEHVLVTSIQTEHIHLAIRQLFLLRQLWPADVFGSFDDSAADFLIKIYFKHLEDKSKDSFYAILGFEDSSHDMCERLMEVNGQIQQSLDALALNAGDIKTPVVTKKTPF